MKPAFALTVVLVLAGAQGARAEDLAEAIALAYDSNPTLLGQRAQLQATNEQYVQAEAGFRPTVSAQVSGAYSKAPQVSPFGGDVETEGNTGSAALSLGQPLYTGGRATAQVRGARAQIDAGREQLRAVEAQVLFDVIRAYCDVLRDRTALAIQRDSFKELRDAVDEIRARREAGAATVIDVRQAEAQLGNSEALVSSAEAQLEISVGTYVAAVGRSPGDLAAPPPLPAVPASLADALAVAGQENPSIRQAEFAEAASHAQMQEARAAFRPTATLNGSLGYTGPAAPFFQRDFQRAAALSVTISQPIFAGGMIASHTRQSRAQDTAALLQVDAARRSATQSVSQAWSQQRAARLNTVAEGGAARSAQEAYEGMRVEYRAGLRATLDLLIAQETLRDAQVALAGAQHDEYVAEASLLAVVGRLEAGVLTRGLPLYQPEAAFRRVKYEGYAPWQLLPETLDKIGAPGLSRPAPLPAAPAAQGPVRMAGAADDKDGAGSKR